MIDLLYQACNLASEPTWARCGGWDVFGFSVTLSMGVFAVGLIAFLLGDAVRRRVAG